MRERRRGEWWCLLAYQSPWWPPVPPVAQGPVTHFRVHVTNHPGSSHLLSYPDLPQPTGFPIPAIHSPYDPRCPHYALPLSPPSYSSFSPTLSLNAPFSISLHFCLSSAQVQSAGHVPSTSFSLCPGLFQMPLAVLSLMATIKILPLTISWGNHVTSLHHFMRERRREKKHHRAGSLCYLFSECQVIWPMDLWGFFCLPCLWWEWWGYNSVHPHTAFT